MSQNRLTSRGANAKGPAKLPSLQALRVADPQVQRALEVLREWVEVRLGTRGDVFERALTMREFDQQIQPFVDLLNRLGEFDGSVETLRSSPSALPTQVTNGAFHETPDGKLYYGTRNTWREITFEPL